MIPLSSDKIKLIKDGASFCHYAYVLHISGYLGFVKEFAH